MVKSSILGREGGHGSEFSVGCAEVILEAYPSLEVLCLVVPFSNREGKISSYIYNNMSNVNQLYLGYGRPRDF